MADQFANVADKTATADRWVLLTASASPLAFLPRYIICTVAGNITIEDGAATAMVLTAPPVNTPLPLRPYKVTAVTGTFYALY